MQRFAQQVSFAFGSSKFEVRRMSLLVQ